MRLKKSPKLKISGFKSFKIKMPPLRIGDKVASVPIVQGGMGIGISLSGLASAVANAGGIGVIAANVIGMMEPDYYENGREANKRALRREIRKARELSDGIIGVNIMVAMNDFHDLLDLVIEEKVDVVFIGAGLPLKGIPVEKLKEANVKVSPIVSSSRAARLIFSYWEKNYNTVPDAVVVEGPEAGGHLGFKSEQIDDPAFSLKSIVPPVVAEIKSFEIKFNKTIPVIAGGGIYDGQDIYEIFKLGASGVQMATRFVATHECDADMKFKKAFVNCKKDDISIIKSPVGLPGRAILNTFLMDADAGKGKKIRCPWKCLGSCKVKYSKYCISDALNNARLGQLDEGFAFAGSNAYRVNEIVRVKSLVKELKKEYSRMVEEETVHLKYEFEVAFKNLVELRDQYLKTLKKNAKALKAQFGKMLDEGTAAFMEEYKRKAARLEKLKEEYAKLFDRVNQLKEQLSDFLDTTPLKLPKTVPGT